MHSASGPAARPSAPADVPPAVAIVGKKNSGKTTLLVAVAAELRHRGLRIASLKHGHHEMEIDQPGRDSWRHVHEGGAEAMVLVAGTRVALVMQWGEEPDPRELIARFYAGRGYHLVLVEGYKHGPFPRVEVFRRAVHRTPIHAPGDDEALRSLLGVVTDDAELALPCPIVRLESDVGLQPAQVQAVADLLEAHLRHSAPASSGAR